MELRPRAARWFEVVVPAQDAEDAMEALARSGEVQFEWTGEASAAADLDPLRELVSRYRSFEAEYSGLWPKPRFERRCCSLPVEVSAKSSVQDIERWVGAAAPLLAQLEPLCRERAELDQWAPILEALVADDPAPRDLARAGPALRGFCLVLRQGQEVEFPSSLLVRRLDLGDRLALLGLAPADEAAELCAKTRRLGGACLDLPSWLGSDAESYGAALVDEQRGLDRRIRELEKDLRILAERKGVARAAGVLERVDWFLRNAEQVRCEGDYCWITGWTSETEPGGMDRALQEKGVAAPVSLMEPPADAGSPSVMRNPVWLQAFEVFTRAVGVPGVREADPTTWVALLVPLMFGYMCGDVGHGAVILITGVLIRPWTKLWPLLVFAGVASIGFGFAYGDVFGSEDLIEPLWLRPMESPLTILIVPVVVGSLVLTLGILLHAVETCWRGEAGSEGFADLAQLLVYWGLLLVFVDIKYGWLSVIGAGACLLNRLRLRSPPQVLLQGFGHLVESTFTLLLNTLSFARVGAFALAHAALETAVLALADAVEGLAARVVILVTGNLAVILIEGLVVSIQTTRLVLFEFFLRFFEGRGRQFRPTPKPPGEGDD